MVKPPAKKSRRAGTSPSNRKRKKKPSGDRLSHPSDDGPLSTALPTELGPSVQPTAASDNSASTLNSLPQAYHNPYLWNTASWSSYSAIQHPAHSASSFTPNPSQAYPTFSSSILTPEKSGYVSSSGGMVPPQAVPQPTEPPPSFVPTIPGPSPKSPIESSKASDGSESETDDTPSPSSGRKTSKRIRISRRNPNYGFVEGAMVGNKEHVVARKKEPRELQTNAKLAGRRFKREVEDVVCRAERLSNETECWFILCAQLPGSGPAYHYTSPRFRREALEDASGMVSAFQQATYSLNLARRKAAKQIVDTYEKQLAEERERKTEAESVAMAAEIEVGKSHQREQLLLAELEAQKAAVEAYRAQLASKLAPQSESS